MQSLVGAGKDEGWSIQLLEYKIQGEEVERRLGKSMGLDYYTL